MSGREGRLPGNSSLQAQDLFNPIHVYICLIIWLVYGLTRLVLSTSISFNASLERTRLNGCRTFSFNPKLGCKYLFLLCFKHFFLFAAAVAAGVADKVLIC